jgi:nitrous oxidase accessory protein NosD
MNTKVVFGTLFFLLSLSLVPIFVSTPVVSALSCTTTVTSGQSIQNAINSASPGAVICVGPGIFSEQLTISKPLTLVGAGMLSTIIKPNSVSKTATDPDSGAPQAPIILVSSTTGVNIEDLTVDGSAITWTTGCSLESIGILFLGASGAITSTEVTNINLGNAALYGCQTGNAIFVQSPSGKTSAVSITDNTVTNYQKNGITCNDAGTSCTISDNKVSPLAAAEPYIASNGIQIAFGAIGSITGNTITGDECTLANYCTNDLITEAQGTGILTYRAGSSGVTISGNTLSTNDIAIALYLDTSGTISPTGNTILSSKYYGIVIYDESQSILGNTISNTPVGIAAVSDTSGLTVTAKFSDVFSNVDTDCATYTANGGVAVCQSQTVAGVPEFGTSIVFVVAISFVLVLVLRRYRRVSNYTQPYGNRSEF